MPLYKPSELREFLSSHHLMPKKGLSQNFLIDGNIIRKIIAVADVQPGDIVLEIGPGPGALTEALLAAGANVIAVEKDRLLSQTLSRLSHSENQLRIINEDILECSCDHLFEELMGQGKKIKLIANLPYSITTPILVKFVPLETLFTTITVMVQDEVARRFVASPKSADYSSFTLFLNFYSKPKYQFTVSPQCFFPVPKVHSAVVTFELKESPKVSDEEAFFLMTRTAFCHRRKMLRSSLRELYPVEKIKEALFKLKLPEETRPEELPLETWLEFFRLIEQETRPTTN